MATGPANTSNPSETLPEIKCGQKMNEVRTVGTAVRALLVQQFAPHGSRHDAPYGGDTCILLLT